MDLRQITFSALQAANRRPWLRRPFDAAMAPLNPFDEARHVDPYPLYQRARERRGPIFRHRATGLWMVVGHQAAVEVLRGPVSAERGPALRASAPYKHMDPANLDLLTSGILMRDAPDHGRLRRLVSRAFTPRAVTDLGPSIEVLTGRLLADLPAAVDPRTGTVDVMAGLAEQVPVHVISELLGIPVELRDEVKALSDVVARFVEPFGDFDPATMDQAVDRLRDLFGALAASARCASPGSGLIGALARAEDGGDRLTRDELVSMLVLMLIAGHETTSGFIGNALLALARHPDARDRLVEQPGLAGAAIEELLRYDSPVQATDRIVVEDFRVGDAHLRPGQLVLVFLGAANRDPANHPEPDRLILDRRNPRPLTFGHGVHHCVGAALTRLEASIVIPAFLQALPRYAVDEAAVTWRRSATLRGPARLPVDPGPVVTGQRSAERDPDRVAVGAGMAAGPGGG